MYELFFLLCDLACYQHSDCFYTIMHACCYMQDHAAFQRLQQQGLSRDTASFRTSAPLILNRDRTSASSSVSTFCDILGSRHHPQHRHIASYTNVSEARCDDRNADEASTGTSHSGRSHQKSRTSRTEFPLYADLASVEVVAPQAWKKTQVKWLS